MQFVLSALTALVVLFGCASVQPNVPTRLETAPSDRDASLSTRAVLRYLDELSDDRVPGVICGQFAGHGLQIADSNAETGFRTIFEVFRQKTGRWPGMIALDYEHDRIFSEEDLRFANQVLIEYWNKDGLVTINWSPINPWLNDESDLPNSPGNWNETRTTDRRAIEANLLDLVDPSHPISKVWTKKLDRIAAALEHLQKAGVVVLWRPMQEMNGFWFWWGTNAHGGNSDAYKIVYRHMHRYFTQVKKLHNLLWVYSPDTSGSGTSVTSNYPGDAYVDVVAATRYDDGLDVSAYDELVRFGKPLGLAEFGPSLDGQAILAGTFDTLLYRTRLLERYPRVAYWVSWGNWDNGNGTKSLLSLPYHRNVNELVQFSDVLTRDRLRWRESIEPVSNENDRRTP